MKYMQSIKMRSLMTKKVSERVITYQDTDLQKFFAGQEIDVAMPYLDEDSRRFLLSGVTPEELAEFDRLKAGDEIWEAS